MEGGIAQASDEPGLMGDAISSTAPAAQQEQSMQNDVAVLISSDGGGARALDEPGLMGDDKSIAENNTASSILVEGGSVHALNGPGLMGNAISSTALDAQQEQIMKLSAKYEQKIRETEEEYRQLEKEYKVLFAQGFNGKDSKENQKKLNMLSRQQKEKRHLLAYYSKCQRDDIDGQAKIITSACNFVQTQEIVRTAKRNDNDAVRAESMTWDKTASDIADTHVGFTLIMWLMLMLGKYHMYAFSNWDITSGMGAVGVFAVGYMIPAAPQLATIMGSHAMSMSFSQCHSFSYLFALFCFQMITTVIAGYHRRYLDGLHCVCVALMLWVSTVLQLVPKHLSAKQISPASQHNLQYIGGAGVAFVICGLSYKIYHSSSGNCELPVLSSQANTVYVGPDCYPSKPLKVGSMCEIACKDGYMNSVKLQNCGWFTSCASTTYTCMEDLSGSYFKDTVDLICYPKAEDPYQSSTWLW